MTFKNDHDQSTESDYDAFDVAVIHERMNE